MWIEIIMQVVMQLLKNCPQEATHANVERLIKSPTIREKRLLRLGMRREADKQLDAYLEGGEGVAMSDVDKDYICAEICEKLGISH